MTGRKPYPIATLVSDNKNRRITQAELKKRMEEPSIGSNELTKPDSLSEEAGVEWDRISALYKELNNNYICNLDANALEIYCEALVTYRRAIKMVRKSSEVLKLDGTLKKNPWQTVANEASTIIKKYGENLLLDPVGRARAAIGNKKDDKPVNKFDRFGSGAKSG